MVGRNGTLMNTLREIESSVLERVWLGSRRLVVGAALAATLAGASLMWWCGRPVPGSSGVPAVSAAMFVVASATSAILLVRRRYRWCCAALYCSGLATVIGIGAFWWLRTGRHSAGLGWLVLADVVAMALALCWATVVVTPIEQSQPDMRRRPSSYR
ncbi:hypothetical protein [Mycobacterium sp. 141]|uniref:hypothetical protein n=1 Tax=Mycobacterium sp. 141 TaxID=1120797 RepID=UPI00039BF8F7|nr:hypothetical protein [Mycobacterium sp. 141]